MLDRGASMMAKSSSIFAVQPGKGREGGMELAQKPVDMIPAVSQERSGRPQTGAHTYTHVQLLQDFRRRQLIPLIRLLISTILRI